MPASKLPIRKGWHDARRSGRRAKSPEDATLGHPTGNPRDKIQVNLTDPQSRIMPVTGKGVDHYYNTQAAVDTDTLLVTHVKWSKLRAPL